VNHIKRIKPATAKGTFVRQAHLAATMSPAVPVSV
jgi:ribosomal protein L1